MRRFHHCTRALLIGFAFLVPLGAQEITGTILGAVTDNSGAAVPGGAPDLVEGR